MSTIDESTAGLLRYSRIPPVEILMGLATGLFGFLNKATVRETIKRLSDERNYFQDRYLQADSELSRIEQVVVLLNEFDANGEGDCGDRLVAAIKRLKASRDSLRDERNTLLGGHPNLVARTLRQQASDLRLQANEDYVLSASADIIPAPPATTTTSE